MAPASLKLELRVVAGRRFTTGDQSGRDRGRMLATI